MRQQIVRGQSFVRETTFYVDAFWNEEGGMGEEEYCQCKDIDEAFAKLQEADLNRPGYPWRISIYVDDSEPENTEIIKTIKD